MTAIFAATSAAPQERVSGFARAVKRVAALSALALLAACQSVVPKGGNVPVAGPKPDPIVIPADGRHQVALLLPITGPDGDVGQSIANAAALAMTDTNSTTKINLKTYDTALGVAAAAQQAVADGNKLILGPLRGDNVVTAADIARTKNVPIISFSNDIGVAGRNVYVLGHLPSQSVDRIVRFAKAKGKNRFGAIVSNNVYGQRASSNLTISVRDAGGVLVNVQQADDSQASIDAAVARLKAEGPVDAILIGGTGGWARMVAPSLKRSRVNAQILGTELWNIDSRLASSADMRGAWFASVADGYYRQFAEKYRTRYGKAPLRLSSLGYDAILLTSRVSQEWQLGTTFPITNLIDPGGFIGIDGAFRFSGNGLSERMLEVQEVRAGQFTVIEAAPGAFAK
ncbi:penicillin-binding protein activator [Sphingorhabdus arenilitoris]|uniref:Penicillin-binding protein activator n=1 Tax=Sphingorhabdus arenilitoris TaxID=1490041 RepID=A0ABV8RHC6_9SPHN